MSKRFFYSSFIIWFLLVNLPQFVPSLNRIEPIIFGLPFNMLWIWSLNLLITIIMIVFIVSHRLPSINFKAIKNLVKEKGLEVKEE